MTNYGSVRPIVPKERHEMFLVETYPSGVRVWECPTCKRRMAFVPDEEKGGSDLVIYEYGDKSAVHFGGVAGLRLVGMKLRKGEPDGN